MITTSHCTYIVVGWIMKDIHALMLRTCEYIVLYGIRDFADEIKCRTLKWGDHPGLYGWVHCNHLDHHKRDAG